MKRDFYAAMCKSEGWTVRTLRDRKNSMLYERTAISRKPEETIRGDIMQLMDPDKMSKMPPKKLLEEKLAIAIANAKEQLEQR